MRPRKPRGLGTAGSRLWDATIDEFMMDDNPPKLALLEHACRVSDVVAKLEKASAKEPLVVRGSAGQLVSHPNISECRAQRSLLMNLLSKLNFDDEG